MVNFPKKLAIKIQERAHNNALRTLSLPNNLIDFYSNDYLGFACNATIFEHATKLLLAQNLIKNGATGSRLLSGNSEFYEQVEHQIAAFHETETALLFNSGYDANIGFFSAVPQRGDIILYDEFIHASIRDGITMSAAKAYKFKHNILEDLQAVINRVKTTLANDSEIYIVTESVFSMDGDTPNLKELIHFCTSNTYRLVVDEAHAIGVFGEGGQGLVHQSGLQNQVFAQIVTFGKGMGCHGAAILGSQKLKEYLINFSRSFMYTTGLPPHAIATIRGAYKELEVTASRTKLHQNISFFKEQIQLLALSSLFIPSDSSIHCCIISGNEKVKKTAAYLQKNGFNVKPILSPTVPKGQERLRFCLHSYNTNDEIIKVLSILDSEIRKMNEL